LKRIDPSIPGSELINEGLADLLNGKLSESALLILEASTRLRDLGVDVPGYTVDGPPSQLLYLKMRERLQDGAHSAYNASMRRLFSAIKALELNPPAEDDAGGAD
jgi:hypothetical protein